MSNEEESDKASIFKSDDEKFDDLIIDITQNRISQELIFSSSIQTKAGVLMGFVGVIISILFAQGFPYLINTLIKQLTTIINQNASQIPFTISFVTTAVGSALLIISVLPLFFILVSNKRRCLINPKTMNNTLRSALIKNSKHEIKCKLIDDLNSIKNDNSIKLNYLRKAYGYFAIGVGLISVPFFINTITQLINHYSNNPITQ